MPFLCHLLKNYKTKRQVSNHKIKSINNIIQRWVGFGHFIKVGGGGGGRGGQVFGIQFCKQTIFQAFKKKPRAAKNRSFLFS